jgi:DNA-binding transcriptional LysR family regulator
MSSELNASAALARFSLPGPRTAPTFVAMTRGASGTSAPRLSDALRRLEGRLGVRLLHRKHLPVPLRTFVDFIKSIPQT